MIVKLANPWRFFTACPGGSRRPRRSGMTLVELLVVIAIIGILVALTLPAVQMARETARKATCQNHLKQLGLAAHLHHDLHRHFPTDGWGYRWVGDPDRGFGANQPGGWVFNLLPFVEQSLVREMPGQASGPARGAAAARMLQNSLQVFHCPSRRPPDIYNYGEKLFPLYNSDAVAQAAKSDYAINGGSRKINVGPGPPSLRPIDVARYAWPSLQAANGISFVRSEFSMAQVLDGTSNTLLLGEKNVQLDGDGTEAGDDQTMYLGDDADIRRWSICPPMRDRRGVDFQNCFGSRHNGGAFFVLCDGGVRMVSYEVDPVLFGNLGNRHDGNPIDFAGL